jgi:hypothetical protein
LIVLFVLAEIFGNTPDPEQTVYRGFGAMNVDIPAYFDPVKASLGLNSLPVHLVSYRGNGVLRRL